MSSNLRMFAPALAVGGPFAFLALTANGAISVAVGLLGTGASVALGVGFYFAGGHSEAPCKRWSMVSIVLAFIGAASLIGAIGLNVLAHRSDKKTGTGATSQSSTGSASHVAVQRPSMFTIFMTDIRPSNRDVAINGMRVSQGDDDRVIYSNRIADFDAYSRYLTFYIQPGAGTFGDVAWLADHFARALDVGYDATFKADGGSSIMHANQMPFSGKVFVYYDWTLSAEQIADLTKRFRGKGAAVEFRGPEYANVVWDQIRLGEKPTPQAWELRNGIPHKVGDSTAPPVMPEGKRIDVGGGETFQFAAWPVSPPESSHSNQQPAPLPRTPEQRAQLLQMVQDIKALMDAGSASFQGAAAPVGRLLSIMNYSRVPPKANDVAAAADDVPGALGATTAAAKEFQQQVYALQRRYKTLDTDFNSVVGGDFIYFAIRLDSVTGPIAARIPTIKRIMAQTDALPSIRDQYQLLASAAEKWRAELVRDKDWIVTTRKKADEFAALLR